MSLAPDQCLRILEVTREWVGKAVYTLQAEECQPPDSLNCFLLVAWAFGEARIQAPRTLRAQLYWGQCCPPSYTKPGCLIFTSGRNVVSDFVDAKRARHGVGHVGIISEGETVLHVCWRRATVVEDPLEQFLREHAYRGIYQVSG